MYISYKRYRRKKCKTFKKKLNILNPPKKQKKKKIGKKEERAVN